MIKQEFGAQIRKTRLQKEMTQESLSQSSGVTLRYLQDIEAGNKQPSITVVFKLASGLGVTPDDLLLSIFSRWQKAEKPEE